MNKIGLSLLLLISQVGFSQTKEATSLDPVIKQLTQELIDNGTIYNLEYLDKVYDDNLKYIRIDPKGNITLVSKQDNMEFFKGLKESGAKPLSKYAEFHYADNDGKRGFIILTRKMERMGKEQEFLFNIYWEKINGDWKIIREAVYLK